MFVGSFDEFAADEGGAGADEGDEVRCVDGAPAVLGGFDEFECHGQPLTDEWLPAMRHVIKPTTLASYEDYARAYVVPVLGNVRLQDQLTAPRLNALARLNLPTIRLHDVRHSYATAALSAGVHPKIVSERLGHASVAFTLTQYSRVLPGVDEEAAKTIADLMLRGRAVHKSVHTGGQDATRASIPEDERPGPRGSGGRI